MPPAPKKKPGNQQPPEEVEDDNEDGEEAPVTRSEIVKLINGAVSGQLARKIGPAIEASMKPVIEQLKQMTPPKKDDEDDDEQEDGDDEQEPTPPKKGKVGKPDLANTKLQRQLDAMKRQLEEEKLQRAKEAEARKNSTIETELTKALTEIGVDKHRLRGALAVHKASATVDENGNVVFKMKGEYGEDEEHEPATALKKWSETDEGKSYLAPTGSQGGAGARPPRPSGPKGKPAPNSPEAKAQKMADAKQALAAGVAAELAGGIVSIE